LNVINQSTGGNILNISQKEVAERLGVSRGTLHRVLVGSPLVNARTRERIERELEEFNYIPNRVAQSLKSGRSMTIGVLGPARIRTANMLKVNAIYEEAAAQGYSVIIAYSDGSEEGDEHGIRQLLSHMVDGIIVMGRGLCHPSDHFKAFQRHGKPIISIYPVYNFKCDCVTLDTAAAFEELTTYLIGLGHQRIGLAIFSPRESRFVQMREKGYCQALEKAKIPIDPELIVCASTEEVSAKGGDYVESLEDADADYAAGYWATEELIRRKCGMTALVCASDDTAIGALCAAHAEGLSVPKDLAVVGYDDSTVSRYTIPPLTTIQQPNPEMGKRAVDILISRIEGRLTKKRHVKEELPFELIVRDSCGARLKSKQTARKSRSA